MYDNVMNTQQVADGLKATLLDMPRAPKQSRLEVLRTLTAFEQCGWHAGIFEAVAHDTLPGGVTIDDSGQFDWGDLPAPEIVEAIDTLMSAYIQETLPRSDGWLPHIYDMGEAAEYLGVSRDMLKTWVSREGRLRGRMVGRSMVFTKAQLDAFQKTRQGRGRPAVGEAE